ncbi:hypothetical protein RYX36_024424, partial [Vicia faba]
SQVVQLALKCIRTEPKVRPSMKEVLETLESNEAVNEKPTDNINRTENSKATHLHGQPDGVYFAMTVFDFGVIEVFPLPDDESDSEEEDIEEASYGIELDAKDTINENANEAPDTKA